ncbi:faciogenital dysplasia protein [Anaeramoeba flamelloides]|uniref:Faciogenital dysplasia protein n=1 Tax=Anaeramoeba flamelloides TaxID=1746091 RepID=A0ABQ8ZAV0_9EUKA|nr:faciogenital dysplasia protein [Anaeramoeba flamelloides]
MSQIKVLTSENKTCNSNNLNGSVPQSQSNQNLQNKENDGIVNKKKNQNPNNNGEFKLNPKNGITPNINPNKPKKQNNIFPKKEIPLLNKIDNKTINSMNRIQNVFRGYQTRKKILEPEFENALTRRYLIQEIIETEKTYVSLLDILVKEFLIPLKKQEILDQTQLSKIFSNIETIFGLNQKLYEGFLERRSNLETRTWSDLFSRFVPFLKIYSLFISNYNTALKTLETNISTNETFNNFLNKVHSLEQLNELKIFDLLITPVQRIPRYVLLIRGVIKSMDQNHKEREEFCKVLRKLKEVANHVNKIKLLSDNFRKLINLQIKLPNSDETLEIISGRRLIKEGHLIEIRHQNPDISWGILFNDIFISATKIGERKFEARVILPIDGLSIRDLKFSKGISKNFSLTGENDTFIFQCNNSRIKTEWIKVLKSTQEENIQRKKLSMDGVQWAKIETHGKFPPNIHNTKGCILNKQLYIFSGNRTNSTTENMFTNLYILNLDNWEWETKHTMNGSPPTPRSGNTMSLIEDRIFIFGGMSDKKRLSDLHIFSISYDLWINNPETYGTPPTKRSGHSASVIKNQLWIFGGKSGEREFLNDLYCLDTTTFTWYRVIFEGFKPLPRALHSSICLGKQLLVFGGISQASTYDDLWVFDLENFYWYEGNIQGKQPMAKYSHSCIIINNMIWFVGGNSFNNERDLTFLDLEKLKWSVVHEEGEIPNKNERITILSDQSLNGNLFFRTEQNESKVSNIIYTLDTMFRKGISYQEEKNIESEYEIIETTKIKRQINVKIKKQINVKINTKNLKNDLNSNNNEQPPQNDKIANSKKGEQPKIENNNSSTVGEFKNNTDDEEKAQDEKKVPEINENIQENNNHNTQQHNNKKKTLKKKKKKKRKKNVIIIKITK